MVPEVKMSQKIARSLATRIPPPTTQHREQREMKMNYKTPHAATRRHHVPFPTSAVPKLACMQRDCRKPQYTVCGDGPQRTGRGVRRVCQSATPHALMAMSPKGRALSPETYNQHCDDVGRGRDAHPSTSSGACCCFVHAPYWASV